MGKSEVMNIEQKMAKILIKLRDIRPFYSAIYEAMPHIETTRIDTMAVTSSQLLYNREFVEKLEFKELLFVVLHEVAHISLMHVPRMRGRDKELWNIACDLFVNKLLADEFDIGPNKKADKHDEVTFIKESLYSDSIDTHNDYTEAIYEQMHEQAENNGYFGSGEGKFDFEVRGSKGGSYKFKVDKKNIVCDLSDDGSDENESENENKRILAEALTKSKMHSMGSGNLEKIIEEMLKSYVDWRKLLRKYCRNLTRTDSSFSSPDKRMYYQSAIYPGQMIDITNMIKGVKICFDSSGSVSDKDMGYFYGQVLDLMKEFKIESELIFWDTRIEHRCNLSKEVELINKHRYGYGGTSPECIFAYFDSKECKIKPEVAIIFTDGFFNFNVKNKKWLKKYKHTIWVMTRDYNKEFKPQFGTLTIAKFEKH